MSPACLSGSKKGTPSRPSPPHLYLRSGGATTLIFMAEGASAVISLLIRSAMPGNIVVPPDSTMLL